MFTFETAFIRSFKLFFAEKKNIILFCFCLFLIIFGISMLLFNAREQSSLPIGLYNLDSTEFSADLIKKLEENPALNIKYGSKDNLLEMLEERKVSAVYVINEDFGDKIEKGETEGLFSVFIPYEEEKCFLISDIIAGDLMDALLSHRTEKFYYDYDKNDRQYLAYLESRKNDPMFLYEFEIIKGGNEAPSYETDSLSMIYYEIMEVFVTAVILLLLLEIIGAVTVNSSSPIGIREKTVSKSAFGEMLGVFAFTFSVLTFIQLITCLIFGMIMLKDGISGAYAYVFENFFRDLLAQIPFFVVFYFGRRKISSVQFYQFLGIFLICIYGGGRIFSLIVG